MQKTTDIIKQYLLTEITDDDIFNLESFDTASNVVTLKQSEHTEQAICAYMLLRAIKSKEHMLIYSNNAYQYINSIIKMFDLLPQQFKTTDIDASDENGLIMKNGSTINIWDPAKSYACARSCSFGVFDFKTPTEMDSSAAAIAVVKNIAFLYPKNMNKPD